MAPFCIQEEFNNIQFKNRCILPRTSDGGNGNYSVLVPIILIKN